MEDAGQHVGPLDVKKKKKKTRLESTSILKYHLNMKHMLVGDSASISSHASPILQKKEPSLLSLFCLLMQTDAWLT